LKRGQTIKERAGEVRTAVGKISQGITVGRVKVRISKAGAIAFAGVTEEERDGISDVCAYRLIMATGPALAKAAIARAELMSGTSINKSLIAQGTHSHDGGITFHDHKG